MKKRRGAEAQKRRSTEVEPLPMSSAIFSWSGPPGCTCDLNKPAKGRCTKGGWLRCQGALNAMMAQMRYRDGVGMAGGPGKKGKTFLDIFTNAQKKTGMR